MSTAAAPTWTAEERDALRFAQETFDEATRGDFFVSIAVGVRWFLRRNPEPTRRHLLVLSGLVADPPHPALDAEALTVLRDFLAECPTMDGRAAGGTP